MKRIVNMVIVMIIVMTFQHAAWAQTKLKLGHLNETFEPQHEIFLWAADEISKRTNGKYIIEVFPNSQLGNEPDLNQGISMGTIEIVFTGSSFAGTQYKPLNLISAPYVFRDYDHFLKFAKSNMFKNMVAGYNKTTGNHILAITYRGERHTTSNKLITKPEDMAGMKLRVPQAPMYLMFAKAVNANATPIAFAEVYLALQQGLAEGQENPLSNILAKKFYEVQTHVALTGHMTETSLTIMGNHVWGKLTDEEKQIFKEVFQEAADKTSTAIRQREGKQAEELAALGKTVNIVDRKSFKKKAEKLVKDEAKGWTEAQFDELQAIN